MLFWEKKNFLALGSYLFAVAMLLFGAQQLLSVVWIAGPIPGPPWLSGGAFWACCFGIILCSSGLCIVLRFRARLAATLVSLLVLLRAAILYFPGLLMTPRNPGNWTSGFELLGMCGAGLVFAATFDRMRVEKSWPVIASRGGEIVFAAALVVVGVQHFLYADFVATIVPSWIPAKLFWAYFVGVAFFTAALSIVLRRIAHLSTALLGAMFLTFFLILHIPRVAAAPNDGKEWTSAFVALAFGGGALILGSAGANRREEPAV
jgi:uncharacterized membrane protein